MSEQRPIICPKCGNAVYVPNFTAYSCPYCSIEVDTKEKTTKETEKPMSTRKAIFTIGMTVFWATIAVYYTWKILGGGG
jgi:uncharacterized membrane protein YvbJ